MTGVGLDALCSEIRAIEPVRPVGRISAIGGGTVTVTGLSATAALGDLLEMPVQGNEARRGEVLTLASDHLVVLPDDPVDGLQIGNRVLLLGQDGIAPHDSWIGRVEIFQMAHGLARPSCSA